jgi:CheY-like chemotaxis protein
MAPQMMPSRRWEDPNHQVYRLAKRQILQSPVQTTGVIVADDDPMVRSVLRAQLEALNLNVFVAGDGLEAVELASRVQAVMIILDLQMPRMNGMLACKRIRLLPGNAQTPIVILTSTSAKDAEAVAARVGATAYFMKPFRPALLLQALAGFLPISDSARNLIRRNADRANGIAQSTPTSVDDMTARKLRSDDALDRGKNILDVLRG